MKKLKLGISALALAVASTAMAQTTTNPWLIGVGAHGENYVAAPAQKVSGVANKLFTINNFSFTPPLSRLTVARNVNKYLVIDLQASVGNVSNKRFNTDKEFFFLGGLGAEFKINGLWNEDSWFDPYIRAGVSYLRQDYSSMTFPVTDVNGRPYSSFDKGNTTGKANFLTTPIGAGLNLWFTHNFGLGVQGDYVSTPGKYDIPNFWQASASLLFRFGNTDRDHDGIPDKEDRCPDTPGLPEFQGCPDSDGDGIPDIDDKCPNEAGPKENNGCPWPDTDGDGLTDNVDKCPTVAGPKENDGCPWPDRDGDGIPDKDDKCPDVPGLAQYQGCPEPAEITATKKLQGILFDFNKATIQAGSSSKLDDAAEVIKANPDQNFLIVGMTDAKGAAAYNLNLSRLRAKAVKDALVARGVNPDHIKSIGIGSQEATVPATASDAERQVDRKVVVRAISGSEWTTYKSDDVTVAKPAVKKAVKKTVKKRK